MAYATNSVDINRVTDGIELPPEISAEIWASAETESAIMQLAQRIDLPGNGLSIPVITGDPVADFVTETAEKPVSSSTFEPKLMTPYKVAVIELFSNEFRRDLTALYDELVRRLPSAIAKQFDATVFHGIAPGTGFDTLEDVSAVSLTPASGENIYNSVVAAYETIADANYELNGWALSAKGISKFMGAQDGNGYPLFTTPADGSVGRIIGAPVAKAPMAYLAGNDGNDIVGYAGDWTQARYGIVDGINVAISTEATVNDGTQQINLWQRNMFAVRVEAELGFVVRAIDAFVALTHPSSSLVA